MYSASVLGVASMTLNGHIYLCVSTWHWILRLVVGPDVWGAQILRLRATGSPAIQETPVASLGLACK